jgi:hypothetical protein
LRISSAGSDARKTAQVQFPPGAPELSAESQMAAVQWAAAIAAFVPLALSPRGT